jgi:mRNA-degrading endonuclease RelE of RelBE toxin-antitoxin system
MIEIFAIPSFDREVKKLRKKYRNISSDLASLEEQILADPYAGTLIPNGKGTRKIRMAISDKNKGKRDGARVITYLVEPNDEDVEVWLLSIYDKSEQSDISEAEINTKITEKFALDEDNENPEL